jgi:hypothetical protein
MHDAAAGLNVTPLGETGGSAKRAGSQSQQYGRNPRRAPASVGASSRLLEPEIGLSAKAVDGNPLVSNNGSGAESVQLSADYTLSPDQGGTA